MSMLVFFHDIVELNRQLIAEVFFALLILLMIDRKLALRQRFSLFIVFSLSLIVSHYAVGYICIAYLLGSWVIVALIHSKARIIWEWLTRKFGGLPQSLISDRAFSAKTMAVIIGIYLVFMLGWYGAIGGGGALSAIRYIGQGQYSLLSSELTLLTEPTPAEPTATSAFLDPATREDLVLTALGLDFFSASAQGKGFRIFQLITELFIILGFIRLLLKPKGFKFRAEYIALAMGCALILLACIVIPNFSGYLEVQRFYHITLFLLSPLCILGGEVMWQGLSRLFNRTSPRLKDKEKTLEPASSDNMPADRSNPGYFKFLALAVLIPYLLFNTGFIFEVTRSEQYNVVDTPSSEALSSHRIDMKSCNAREHAAHEWLPGVVDDKTPIYGDQYALVSRNIILYSRFGAFPSDTEQMTEKTYIYLGTWNIEKNEAVFMFMHTQHIKFKHINFDALPELYRLIDSENLIYNNGGAHILAPWPGNLN